MRFGLKCIVALAILYRAIIVSQGGTETAELSSAIAEAVPQAQAHLKDEIASRIDGWCRGDPAGCLDHATRLARFVAGDLPAAAAISRRPGAMAAPTR